MTRVTKIILEFHQKKIYLLGELCIDFFLWGAVSVAALWGLEQNKTKLPVLRGLQKSTGISNGLIQNLLVSVPCSYCSAVRCFLFLVSPSGTHFSNSCSTALTFTLWQYWQLLWMTHFTIPLSSLSIQVSTFHVDSGSSHDLHLTSALGSLLK